MKIQEMQKDFDTRIQGIRMAAQTMGAPEEGK